MRVVLMAACFAVLAGAQPEFIRQGQQLVRQGKLDEALALYRQQDSAAAHNAAGVVLDLMGRGVEARSEFEKAIAQAPDARAKAMGERALAMSYAFAGDCGNTVAHEQRVFDFFVSVKDFYQHGEIADEAARVCIDTGDLDTAEHWYRVGHGAGLQQPDLPPGRKALWEFRWEHAQARLAARRGRKGEAAEHVARAKALLDQNPDMARQQAVFFPYLTGYVAFYGGDYKTALADLRNANQNDPFIQVLMGQACEQLGDRAQAVELYRKAAAATAHNPPAAYARPFATRKLR